MKLTYETLLDDPDLLRQIEAQARHARAEAVSELIIEPIKHVLTDHAPRPNLARQG